METIRQTMEKYLVGQAVTSNGSGHVDLIGDLFETGILDSFAFVELIAYIERSFSIQIGPEEMLDPGLATVDGLVTLIERKQSG